MQWFRWHHGTTADPKFRTIARKSGQPVHVVIAVWAAVLEYASESEHRGTIACLDVEDVASCLDMDGDAVAAVLSAMQGKVLDGETLTGWDRRQPKREDASSERVRNYRERQRTQADDTKRDVTQCNAPEQNRADSEQKIPPSPIGDAPPKAKKASRLPDKWQPSDEDRTFAEQSGVDVDREAAKFRDYWQAKSGKDATKLDWSAMWRNWVRRAAEDQSRRKPDRQHDPTGPAKRYAPTEAEMRTAVRKWKSGGPWPAYLGPRPDMVSTSVPKHILAEEGV